MRRGTIGTALATLVFFAAPWAARAEVFIGPYSFADDAFADTLVSATPATGTGDFRHEFLMGGSVSGTPLTLPDDFAFLESLLVGVNLENWVGVTVANASLTLGFDPPLPVDGPGPDLVVFDIGNRETIRVTIGGATRTYTFVDTGENVGPTTDLNAIEVDLADFGVPSASALTLTSNTANVFDADPTAAGALNVAAPVPSGGSFLLALAGALALLGARGLAARASAPTARRGTPWCRGEPRNGRAGSR